MDTYLSISDAAQVVHLSEKYLYELVQTGTIRSAIYSGTVLVNQQDAEAHSPIWNREGYDSSLRFVEIGIVEASERYDIAHPTISRWVKSGKITLLRQDGRKKLISEGDVKYYAGLYHAQGGAQGRWIFDKSGNVYAKKLKSG